jgi:RimJ/RimL family protein N-acetyltransferase
MFEVLSDPQIYSYIEDEPPPSVASLAERYAAAAPRCSPDGQQGWFEWVVLRGPQGLGYVQATVYPERHETGLAYVFASQFWGQGYAHEACQAVIKHLRGALGPHRMLIDVDTRNRPSQRLAERLGFRLVARLPGVNHLRGEISDDFRYHLNLDP